VIPEFGLRLHQSPTGYDFSKLAKAEAIAKNSSEASTE
jgi:hypothetical protein